MLWPDLIAQWDLPDTWVKWFDQREGNTCAWCQSSLRSRQLAEAILDALNGIYKVTATDLDKLSDTPCFRALRIAEINSAGTLHRFLAKCPSLLYSEYGSNCANIPSENLMALSYGSGTLDLVITAETLEHVPDVDAALREIYRVLKPGGLHVFTTPIVWDGRTTRRRALVTDGEIVHLLPASFHGSPLNNRDDLLVFYEFGADFVQICEGVGFNVRLVHDCENPALVAFITQKRH